MGDDEKASAPAKPGAAAQPGVDGGAAPEAGTHIKDAITLARDVAAIIGIFLFFTGILYRDYFLTALQGIADSGDNSALPQMAVYAYAVLSDNAVWAAALLVLIAAASVAAARWPHMLNRFTNARYAVVILGVVAVFLVLDLAARSAAQDAVLALRVQSDAIRTRVFFTNKARETFKHVVDRETFLDFMLHENDAKGLRVVAHSEKGLVVLTQPCTDGRFLHEGHLITIQPGDYVATAAILIGKYIGKPTPAPSPESGGSAVPSATPAC
jgi:hypothetical protein